MDSHNNSVDSSTRAGTIGGTFLILLMNLSSEEVLKTMVLAAVGAVVSFSVSYLLRRIVKKRKTR